MGQSKLCVELNQLKDVSSTELGAGQPDGTVTCEVAEVVDLGATLVELVPVAFDVVVGALEVVLDDVEAALPTPVLVLVVFTEVATATVDEVVLLLDFCCKEALLEAVVFVVLVDEDDKHALS